MGGLGMAKRKIFYYTLNLFETVGNISVDFTELKIFINVFWDYLFYAVNKGSK